LDLQCLATEFILEKNVKTKEEKAFFPIFMSSCPEMGVLVTKKEKFTSQGSKIFFSGISILIDCRLCMPIILY
jgi:hypothetical protein